MPGKALQDTGTPSAAMAELPPEAWPSSFTGSTAWRRATDSQPRKDLQSHGEQSGLGFQFNHFLRGVSSWVKFRERRSQDCSLDALDYLKMTTGLPGKMFRLPS